MEGLQKYIPGKRDQYGVVQVTGENNIPEKQKQKTEGNE
ncbi:hypothetical protein M2451_003804 [Dysgonomonas sp. PFB1-18]|nr:hypothetical protein [Dysgonomonas sp. PF1-14]MDH6340845.1 hypothetical protein [Dysgonomonas sp. PF1-16]MDH6382463.1 hypothetical protein [Dysgonomonas sp. PFB1-18]MDH6399812.1 hypothetical protein [Dysgonomonas sp. PF1-23]